MTKKKGSSGGGGGGNHDATTAAIGSSASHRKRQEQPLQAVVLAADWSTPQSSVSSYQPLSHEKQPKVLCPIGNQTMIDYTIHYLRNQGVQEVYIVCVSYEIEHYIHQMTAVQQSQSHSQFTTTNSGGSSGPMKIVVVRDTTITNDGDALREMEKRNVIQSDPFVLLYGDTITNISLKDKIQHYHYCSHHTSNDGTSNNLLCMMLLTAVGTLSPLHSTIDQVVIGFSPNTPVSSSSSSSTQSNYCQRIVLYDNKNNSRTSSSHRNHNGKSVQVPCSFLTTTMGTQLQLRTDLYDTGIDLCSPDLLVRFSDEFDYQHIRKEFIANTVAEEEIGLQQSIYGCIIHNNNDTNINNKPAEYCARIHDLRTYHIISNDLLRRTVYPTVPDNVAVSMATTSSSSQRRRYLMQHHFMYYQHESVSSSSSSTNNNIGSRTGRKSATAATRIGRTSMVTGPGLIGHNCFIDEHCCIRSSVIGSHCSVSDHCTIRESHIWDHTIIEANVVIYQSIIGDHVVIHSGVRIPRGCVIGSGCVIGTNMKLQEYTRITCAKSMVNDEFSNNNDGNENHDDWDDDPTKDDTDTRQQESADDDDHFVSDVDIVGTDGRGRVWQPPLPDMDDDDDDDDEGNAFDDDVGKRSATNDLLLRSQCIGYDARNFYSDWLELQGDDDVGEDDDSFSDSDNDMDMGNRRDMYDDDDFDDDDDDENIDHVTFGELTLSTTINNSNKNNNNATTIIGRQDGVDVVKELKLICLEHESGSSIDNLGIELNSYKFSQNATYADCTMAAIMAIVESIHITTKMGDGQLISAFKLSIHEWSPLLQKMSIGIDEEVAILLGLERCAIGEYHGNNSDGGDSDDSKSSEQMKMLSSGRSFRLLLQLLHDEEIVNEEAILKWANERRNDVRDATTTNNNTSTTTTTPPQQQQQLRSRRIALFQLETVQDFLEWLEEGDDDEDEDDEDDNDEEE